MVCEGTRKDEGPDGDRGILWPQRGEAARPGQAFPSAPPAPPRSPRASRGQRLQRGPPSAWIEASARERHLARPGVVGETWPALSSGARRGLGAGQAPRVADGSNSATAALRRAGSGCAESAAPCADASAAATDDSLARGLCGWTPAGIPTSGSRNTLTCRVAIAGYGAASATLPTACTATCSGSMYASVPHGRGRLRSFDTSERVSFARSRASSARSPHAHRHLVPRPALQRPSSACDPLVVALEPAVRSCATPPYDTRYERRGRAWASREERSTTREARSMSNPTNLP